MNFSTFLHLFILGLIFIANGCMANCSSNKSKSCYKTSQNLSNPATEKEATNESKCTAVCVDKLFKYCKACQLEPNTQGQWFSLNFFQIKANCTVYQMFKDCQRGCILSSKNRISNISQCSNQCMSQCPNATQYDSLSNSSCIVKCTPFACENGCQIYDETLNNTAPLSSPSALPIVRSAINTKYYGEGGQCLYSVATSTDTMASSGDSSSDIMSQLLMTAFVFKIEKMNGNTYYISVDTSSGILDLGFLSCEHVNISYKAVTAISESLYSDKISITLDGGDTAIAYPTQVNTVDTYITEDFRDGYTGHAITTISWSKPDNSDYLTHYELIVFSHTKNCGGINVQHRYCIDRDVTNFTIVSETPEKPLFLRCRYSTNLISRPTIDPIFKTISINTESVSDTHPPLSIQCTREFQPNGKLTIYAVWNVSYERGLYEAIDRYTVSLQVFDFSTRSIVPDYPILTTDVYPQMNHTLNVYIARDLPVLENIDRKFMIRVDARSNHQFPWRLMPRYGKCTVDSNPEPPAIINSSTIIINHLSFTNTRLLINFSWGLPLITNGNVTRYDIRIARDPHLSVDVDDPNDFSFIHKVQQVQSTVIDTNAIYQLSKTACLYLQIRSMNNYLWSNWSDSVLLSKYSNNPSCDNIIIGAPEPTTQRAIVSTVIGAVIGGLGAFVLLGVVLAGAVVLCRRYRRRNRYLEAFKDSNADSLYIKSPMGPGVFTTKPLESPQLDEWEIPANLVVIEKRLGEGCFGEVYQGVVKGPINNSKIQASFKNAICPIVAVKLLKSTATGSEKMDFLQEIDTMKTVSKGNNPHVVNLVGCVTIQEPLCLITEFVKHGDLLSYLQSIRKMVTQRQLLEAAAAGSPTANTHNYSPYMIPSLNTEAVASSNRLSIAVPNPESPYAELGEIDSVNLLSFAYQIASGMEFLASLGIVHRDLACRNILVDDGKCLKISDFGMSRMVAADDVYVKNTRGRLPWKWMAIESILNREFTSASDVWSYGVTLWEIATLGGFPYPTITNAELLDHIQKGVRLEKPENCSQDVYEIMLECWLTDPQSRLTFTMLRAKFDSLISAQQDHSPYIDLDIDYGKSYYTSLVEDSDDDDDDNGKEGSPTTSSEGGDPPLEMNTRYDAIRPMLTNSETIISRPVENPYVDTPTKLATCEIRFELSTPNNNDPCPSEIPESPLKKKLTEIV